MQLPSELDAVSELYRRQVALEEESLALGASRYWRNVERKHISDTPPGIAIIRDSVGVLAEEIRLFIKKTPEGGGQRHGTTRGFFKDCGLTPEEIAYVTIKNLLSSVGAPGISATKACLGLYRWLADCIEYKRFRKSAPWFLGAVERTLETQNRKHRRAVIMRAKRKAGIEDSIQFKAESLHIGSKLIDLVITHTGLVHRVLKPGNRGRFEQTLVLSETVSAWINKQHHWFEMLEPALLPMLCEPNSWVGPVGGGYYTNQITGRLTLIKSVSFKAAMSTKISQEVLDIVNLVQRTPWRINQKVLDVLKACRGTAIGGLPRDPKLILSQDLPAKTWDTNSEWEVVKARDPGAAKAYRKDVQAVYDRVWREQGKRLVLAQQISLGERFRNDRIWFPWALDWRGRMYPIPPVLNPQADDVGKSLLLFDEQVAMTDDGLWALASYGASKFGLDKKPLADRRAWCVDNSGNIKRVAANPLDFRWWEEADKPWQFLAFCFEMARDDDMTNLPVSVDGVCNGLQNLSALMRDEVGGRAVNLLPSQAPSDVYKEVADVSRGLIEVDLQSDDSEVRQKAGVWHPLVDRQWCKRNTMTVPYGVTQRGMVEQILEEIKSHDPKPRGITRENMFRLAMYLADKNRQAIDRTVVAARAAMSWLQESSRILADSGVDLKWATPMGFQCHQRYTKTKVKRIQTFWGGIRVRLNLSESTDVLDRKRQALGIAPNLIHSLDACHLMMTVRDMGVNSFSMVHDSYGTHAPFVSKMQKVLREKFVELYQGNFLGVLKAQWEQASGKTLPDLPKIGDLDLNSVKDSVYFFN